MFHLHVKFITCPKNVAMISKHGPQSLHRFWIKTHNIRHACEDEVNPF